MTTKDYNELYAMINRRVEYFRKRDYHTRIDPDCRLSLVHETMVAMKLQWEREGSVGDFTLWAIGRPALAQTVVHQLVVDMYRRGAFSKGVGHRAYERSTGVIGLQKTPDPVYLNQCEAELHDTLASLTPRQQEIVRQRVNGVRYSDVRKNLAIGSPVLDADYRAIREALS